MPKRFKALLSAVFLSLAVTFSAYADVATPADADFEVPAIMQLANDISTYGSMPNASNTVDRTGARIQISYYDMSNNVRYYSIPCSSDGSFSAPRPADFAKAQSLNLILYKKALPSPGKYKFQVWIKPHVGISWSDSPRLYAYQDFKNASTSDYAVSSGVGYIDYLSDTWMNTTINLGSLDRVDLSRNYFNMSWPFGGVVYVRFDRLDSSAEVAIDTTGKQSSADTEQSIADSSSTIASNTSQMISEISDVSEGVSAVAQAIENLQASMEPHYANVLTQLHHITEQLHAFWDQYVTYYNSFVLPHMTLQADRIIDAINHIQVDFGEFSSAIIQNDNKLHEEQLAADKQNADDIMNSYNNSGINSDNDRLNSSLNEYGKAEDSVLESVNDSLNNFEFNSSMDSYLASVSMISGFIQKLYDNSGGFKDVINISFLLSIAGIVIGLYRFKEGG